MVRKGDTLYGIAWRYGLDHRDLARWNGLGSGSFIRIGQEIRLTAPAAAPSAAPVAGTTAPAPASRGQPPGVGRSLPPPSPPAADTAPPRWRWPVDGRIVSEFGADGGPRTGALFDGRSNDPIFAAADGRVVYSGSGLIGYGKLIIVKHNDAFLSAYGHNSELLVNEGDTIQRGQRIARMGEGPGRQPRLHFEIRHNGKPVNPRQYLPAR